MVQSRQGLQSTNTKTVQQTIPSPSPNNSPSLPEKLNELHMHTVHISKLYTDYMGSGNQYLMVAYHCNSNATLVAPFKTWKDKHLLEAYNSIVACLRKNGMLLDLQILDNVASAE